jgi:hypothetical protein
MANPETLIISCESPARIVGTMNAVMPQLAPDVRRRLNRIKLLYLQCYGEEGLYERANGRTVATILGEYVGADPTPITSGEVEGVRYELYDVPKLESEGPKSDKTN